MHPNMQDGSSNLPPPPRVRPKDKSKVESLMKRRYSTRGPLVVPLASEPFPVDLGAKSRTLNVVPETATVFQVLRVGTYCRNPREESHYNSIVLHL